jgi:tetratricopeptide (TPR) repeat protein
MDKTTDACCAECGEEGGDFSLKECKACMSVKYCNAICQKKHWPTHKKECKLRAAELRDEALFKDPPPKEDCPICFLPMPVQLICCFTLPSATILSVPIYDLAKENEGLANLETEEYYPCCGKSICAGCLYSFCKSGNASKCPFCNSDRGNKTREEQNEDLMKRAEANDAASICLLADSYHNGVNGLVQDRERAIELFTRAAELGFSKAHNNLAGVYHQGGDMKKAKFHFEAAAMAGNEMARYNIGMDESNSGNMDRAMKHWMISASAGHHEAMHELKTLFEQGYVSRESIDSTLTAYNNSCAEMRSEARDTTIQIKMDRL